MPCDPPAQGRDSRPADSRVEGRDDVPVGTDDNGSQRRDQPLAIAATLSPRLSKAKRSQKSEIKRKEKAPCEKIFLTPPIVLR